MRPSRITVTRWQVVKTSSSRWEMNRTAAPAPAQRGHHQNSRSTSALESAAVGSSITMHPGVEGQRLGDLDDLLVSHR